MAERNQLRGSLCCHYARQSRGLQGIPFWRSVLPHGGNCFCRYQDPRRCDRSSRGDRFRARIDHTDVAFFIDVSQFFQAASPIVNSNRSRANLRRTGFLCRPGNIHRVCPTLSPHARSVYSRPAELHPIVVPQSIARAVSVLVLSAPANELTPQ